MMEEKEKKHASIEGFSDKEHLLSGKTTKSPIAYLRNSFKKSLALAAGEKISKEVEELITVDITPSHIEGDFTFPVFEIAKALKTDYSTLASNVAKHLGSYKKYIKSVGIVNGYVNIIVKPKTFYRDSILYVLRNELLQESNRSKKIRTVLLVSGQTKINDPLNRPIAHFVHRLYGLHPYSVKTVSIQKQTLTRPLLQKAIRLGAIKNFGNNVLALSLPQAKYVLLQRQDKTPTPLLRELASLASHIKKSKPHLVIFSLNISLESIRELLAAAGTLEIFKDGTRTLVMNDSIMENTMNAIHFNALYDLQKDIRQTIQNKPDVNPKISIQLKDTDIEIARLVSYAPEVFRRALSQASPHTIIKYAELCENPASQFYKSTNPDQPQKGLRELLLHATYKILDASLRLLKQ